MTQKQQRKKNIIKRMEDIYYKKGIAKAIKTLEEMKQDDYENFAHTGISLLGESEWDIIISRFIKKVNQS